MIPSADVTLKYRPDIDGIRALAVVAVVFFHAFREYCPGGFVGVDVSANRFTYADFYSRRIRRLAATRRSNTSGGKPRLRGTSSLPLGRRNTVDRSGVNDQGRPVGSRQPVRAGITACRLHRTDQLSPLSVASAAAFPH
jgi:hypothetical protein